jgi:hypothetical protein
MIHVPANCIPHITYALDVEIERQRAIAELEEDSWPIDYDGNDAPLYRMARESLRVVHSGEDGQLDLSGKPLWFMLELIKSYVANYRSRISPAEYSALKKLYLEHHPWRDQEFPPSE